ncbi:hypothetical protein BD408DRAFT_350401 [Parasitella parasitica]|nr:hypothetical protein BD408DRAFT_350401 [Parasitella parasitica]
MNYMQDCEQMMNESIRDQHYASMITSARFLYSVLRIALTPEQIDENTMDIDMPVLPKLKALGYRVAEKITQVDLKLIEQKKHIHQPIRHRLRELLKIKSSFCLLLEGWDCDTTFRDACNLLTDADDDMAAVLLPYLSTISKKCKQISGWFPAEAIEELRKRINRPSVYVNLMRLLLRTTESSPEITVKLMQLLHDFGSWDQATETYSRNGWNLYLIGMEAGSCRWYELMHLIMNDLRKRAETEASYCWLNALSSLALAEHSLSNKDLSPNLYIKAIFELKVFV